jgi:hypothetical protein
VYMAQAASGRVKVGTSCDVQQRIRGVAREQRESVVLLAEIPGKEFVEESVMRYLAQDALGHEWFRPSDRVMEFVEILTGRLDTRASSLSEYERSWVARLLRGPSVPGAYVPGIVTRWEGQAQLIRWTERSRVGIGWLTHMYWSVSGKPRKDCMVSNVSALKWLHGDVRPDATNRERLLAVAGIEAGAWDRVYIHPATTEGDKPDPDSVREHVADVRAKRDAAQTAAESGGR